MCAKTKETAKRMSKAIRFMISNLWHLREENVAPEKREYRTKENWRRNLLEVGGACIKRCSPAKCRSVAKVS